jgi:hypothetical protein
MKKVSHEFDLTNVKSDVNIYRKEESFKILKACFEVHKELGNGFLEPVYQEALELELFKCCKQKSRLVGKFW